MEIFLNFVAFSEYLNFTMSTLSLFTFSYMRPSKLFSPYIPDNCGDCYTDILAAAADCILVLVDWKPCIEDVLGAGTPCLECICEVIADISSIFNLDWSC